MMLGIHDVAVIETDEMNVSKTKEGYDVVVGDCESARFFFCLLPPYDDMNDVTKDFAVRCLFPHTQYRCAVIKKIIRVAENDNSIMMFVCVKCNYLELHLINSTGTMTNIFQILVSLNHCCSTIMLAVLILPGMRIAMPL